MGGTSVSALDLSQSHFLNLGAATSQSLFLYQVAPTTQQAAVTTSRHKTTIQDFFKFH